MATLGFRARIGAAVAAGFLLAVSSGTEAAAKPDCGKTIAGTKRADHLVGGNAPERIRGYAGNDRLLGRGGGDCLNARAGQDKVRGGRGSDFARGDRGHDRLRGERGNDRLLGRVGRDTISGGKGADRLGGGPGKDRISGGKGRDRLRGGPSNDHLRTADRRRAGRVARAARVDEVDCGPGDDDTAIVDADDRVRRCENVRIRGSEGGGFESPRFALPSWGDVMWSDPMTYRTIQLADITGDGRAELLGRAFNGIEAHEFDLETGQWQPLYGAPDPVLADAAGWGQPEYALTIHTGQLDGEGGEELIARASDGVHAWRYLPDQHEWEELVSAVDACCWSDQDAGWTDPKSYSTIQTADVDGDGLDEIIGRDPTDGIEAYGYDPAQNEWRGVTDASLALTDPDYSQPEYYETIHTADFDGDSRKEIYVRDSAGIAAWKLNEAGTEWVPLGSGPPLSNLEGFTHPEYYETIQTGQLDGEGGDELFVRNEDGILAWSYDPATNTWPELPIGPAMNNDDGWDEPQQYLTIQTADVNSDGRDEILGRSGQGMEVFTYEPAGRAASSGAKGVDLVGDWKQLPSAPLFPDAQGWNGLQYAETIHAGDADGDGADDLIGRSGAGVQTFEYVPGAADGSAWETSSTPFEDFSQPPESTAYAAINQNLGQAEPGFDIRSMYATADGSVLARWQTLVGDMSQPSGVDAETWERVQGRIVEELAAAILVQDWFDNYLATQIQNTFELEAMDTSADELAFDTSSDNSDQIEAVGLDIVYGMLDVAWAGAETTEGGAAIAIVSAVISIGADSMSGGGGGGPLGNLDGPYQQVRGDLQALFQGALTGNRTAKEGVTEDYGLLVAVAKLLTTGAWSEMDADQQASFTAAALRSYTLDVWQMLTPYVWKRQMWTHDPDCNPQEGFICDYVDGSDNGWILENATDSQRSQLISAPDPSCATAWNAATCGLAQSYAEVFSNANGWNLSLDCALENCPRESRKPPGSARAEPAELGAEVPGAEAG